MRCVDCAGSGVVAAHGLGHVACTECDGTGQNGPVTGEVLAIAARLQSMGALGAAVIAASAGGDPVAVKGRLMGYVVGLEDKVHSRYQTEVIESLNRVIKMIEEKQV